MNGECKSYRLNSPMTWEEFKSMPDDIKVTYIKMLRAKFDVPDVELVKMFGTNKDTLSRFWKVLGLRVPRRSAFREWKKDEWYAWLNGVDILPTPVPEEPTEEPVIEEVAITQEEKEAIFFGEEKGYAEDDLPFEDPGFVPVEKYMHLDAEIACLTKRIDELLMVNEELNAVHEKDMAESAWLRNECDNQRMQVRILEAQLEIVHLIFGGRNNA